MLRIEVVEKIKIYFVFKNFYPTIVPFMK